ncbi:DUF262 domain-containing protein [Sodalis sp. RH24]|uniref:DUF262 domain-containing protein n=1 Tax=unclassified Sodalis (in: enterobacteria) TaxID=2636512 RepID=UPI0039B47DC4
MAELGSQPSSVQSIYTWFNDGKLLVNRRYQRKLVWTLDEKRKLIDSLLNKYPIPAILLAEKEGNPGTYEIIDGLQRLHAIMSFIERQYSTYDGRYFDLNNFPTAKTKAEDGKFNPTKSESIISPKEVSTLLDYALALSIMRNASEKEVNDVFDRINTYGHRLSDQERRQAGVQNKFSNMVRDVSCALRGDISSEILPLEDMPSISIDLPSMKHGYDIQADEVFWVMHGILRSTDLRDSMDEQCVADIAACIVGGTLVDRSKEALDDVYNEDHSECTRINAALNAYGEVRFKGEFKHCIDEILKTCNQPDFIKLRTLVFSKKNTNPFQSIFSLIMIALHELIFKENKIISNYDLVRNGLYHIADNISTDRGSVLHDARRRFVNLVKGAIGDGFINNKQPQPIYNSHSTLDVEALIRRSEAELSFYELKQGLLDLSDNRIVDTNLFTKITQTICGMANNGKCGGIAGKIIIGVADKLSDAKRINTLDGIKAHKIGNRHVVGISREFPILDTNPEGYVRKWAEAIRQSTLSEPLKSQVLSNIDYIDFYGKGLLIITVPEQNDVSDLNDKFYWRDADNTKEAIGKEIAMITKRFSSN